MYFRLLFTENSEGSKKGKSPSALSAITLLKKLCNHPDLVYDKILQKSVGFENAAKLMPSNYNTKYVLLICINTMKVPLFLSFQFCFQRHFTRIIRKVYGIGLSFGIH